MNSWSGRLKSKMQELDLTQELLAKKLGVTRSAIAHYVQGTRQPPLKQLVKLATILKIDPAWLQFGKQYEENLNLASASQAVPAHIPIFAWDELLEPTKNRKNIKSKVKYLEYFSQYQNEFYALIIKNDSMISSSSNGITFNINTYIVVDPNKIAEPGNYVLAVQKSKKEAILRQLIKEGGTCYLKPLNPQYPLIELERSIKILGVVIANIGIA